MSLKPRTYYCRRAALIRWTGWTDEEIAKLVAKGQLRFRLGGIRARRLYVVQSAQDIIDAG